MSSTPVPVAHQFDDLQQQRHAVNLGMWLFLATEVLVFSVLFTAYAAVRSNNAVAFAGVGHELYKWIAVTNAVILLVSSGAVAMAVEIAEDRGRAKGAWLIAAASLGAAFLVLKGIEYTLDIREGLLPLVRFDAGRFSDPPAARMFLVFYWIMTGLHAVHVAAGVAVVFSIGLRVRASEQPERLANTVHAVGLYWHFVDLVWLFLLPLLYLNP